MGVKTYIKERFCKIENGKMEKFLPTVLSIYADLVDVHNSEDNKTECSACIVSCPVEHNCAEYINCNGLYRQVYIYNEEHKLIFALPQSLNIKINNNPSGKKNRSPKKGMNSFEMMVGEVILRHYANITWKKYCCSIKNYVEILTTLFFFCPDILWCALKNEMQNDKIDYNVKQAINRCLDFFTEIDQMFRSSWKDMPDYEYEKKILLEIERQGQIDEIKQMIIQQYIVGLNEINRAGIIVKIASDNLLLLCERMCTEFRQRGNTRKVLSKANYKCISNICKTMPGVS